MSTLIVAITGASGSVYAERLLQILAQEKHRVYLVITAPGLQVVEHELGWQVPGEHLAAEEYLQAKLGFPKENFRYFHWEDVGAKIASGSVRTDGMVVIPCTMSTVSGIAHGQSGNLVERAADIMLKEGRPLIVVPRETPLSQLHLQNMLTMAQLGVRVIPAMPAFYHGPQSIEDLVDFMVGRVLDILNIEHTLFQRWKAEER